MTIHPGIFSPADAPATSTVHSVMPGELESQPVRQGFAYWNDLRGARRYPARTQLSPRAMAPFLRNVVLVRVLDGGADYEYRIVGDAHVEALGNDFNHMRLSALEKCIFDFTTRPTYSHVVSSGEPFGIRCRTGRDVVGAQCLYSESVFLPLGGESVDHLLIVTNYLMHAPGALRL